MIKDFYNNQKYLFFFIVLLAFIIRFIYMSLFNGYSVMPVSDPMSYHLSALKILNSGYYEPILHTRPILLPSILATIYYFFPVDNLFYLGRIVTVLLSALSVGLVYLICPKEKIGNSNSFILSLIVCFYPPSIYYAGYILTENLAVLLLLIISLIFKKIFYSKKNNLYLFGLLGILFGLLTLTRSSFLLLPFFIIFVSILLSFFKIKLLTFKNFLIIILLYSLTLMPWTLRNYYKHETFMPTTSRLGYMLFLSNNDFSSDMILSGGYDKTSYFDEVLSNSKDLAISEQSNFLLKKALEEISQNKIAFTKTLVNRIKNSLSYRPNPYKYDQTMNDRIMFFVWIPILLLSIPLFFRKMEKIEITFLIFIIYVVASHLPFWGFPRFRYPVDLFFIYIAFMNYFVIQNFIKKND